MAAFRSLCLQPFCDRPSDEIVGAIAAEAATCRATIDLGDPSSLKLFQQITLISSKVPGRVQLLLVRAKGEPSKQPGDGHPPAAAPLEHYGPRQPHEWVQKLDQLLHSGCLELKTLIPRGSHADPTTRGQNLFLPSPDGLAPYSGETDERSEGAPAADLGRAVHPHVDRAPAVFDREPGGRQG